MKKNKVILVIVVVILSLIVINPVFSLRETRIKNIFPTLVPQQIFFWNRYPFFFIENHYLLTPSGKLVSLPFNTDLVIPTASTIILKSADKLYKFNINHPTGTAKLIAKEVIYVPSNYSGYATLHKGIIYIYSLTGQRLYQTPPPITTFAINNNLVYLVKNNYQLTTISNNQITQTCTTSQKIFAILPTQNTVFLLGKDGITTSNRCNTWINYPQPVKQITLINNKVFLMGKDGTLYSLKKQDWKEIGKFEPSSKLINQFVITSTASYLIREDNSISYYSSWIKSSKIKNVGIYKGELIIQLNNGNFIRVADKQIIPPPEYLINKDKNCKTYKNKFPSVVGCSPSYVAVLTSSDTLLLLTSSGTISSTISIKNMYPYLSYAGNIYLLSNFGLYKLGIYENQIILTIGSKIVTVNENTTTIDVSPRILPPGRTFVPLRFISETLGATVKWNEDDRSITIQLKNRILKLWIGKKKLLVNGHVKNMDVAPFIDVAAGRTLVPLRFIAEYLGAYVYWIPRPRQVIIVQ